MDLLSVLSTTQNLLIEPPETRLSASISVRSTSLRSSLDGCLHDQRWELRALRHYQNSLKAKLGARIDRKEPGSNRWKKLKLIRTKSEQLDHVDNKIRDRLHKLSHRVVAMLPQARRLCGCYRRIRDHFGRTKSRWRSFSPLIEPCSLQRKKEVPPE